MCSASGTRSRSPRFPSNVLHRFCSQAIGRGVWRRIDQCNLSAPEKEKYRLGHLSPRQEERLPVPFCIERKTLSKSRLPRASTTQGPSRRTRSTHRERTNQSHSVNYSFSRKTTAEVNEAKRSPADLSPQRYDNGTEQLER